MLPSSHGRMNAARNGALSWPGHEVIIREAPLIPRPEMAASFKQIDAQYATARFVKEPLKKP